MPVIKKNLTQAPSKASAESSVNEVDISKDPAKEKEFTATNENIKEAPKDIVASNKLLEAIQKGELQTIEDMLSSSEFFHESYKDKEGNTPLHYVGKIQDNNVRSKIAKMLINKGMDIDMLNDNDEKPEHYDEFEKIKKDCQYNFRSDLANAFLIKPFGQERKIIFALILQVALVIFLPKLAFVYLWVWLSQIFLGMLVDDNEKAENEISNLEQIEADFLRSMSENKLTTTKLVKYIEDGVNIHKLTLSELSALEEAVMSENIEQIKFLLPYSPKDIPSAFFRAMTLDNQEIYQELLKHIIDVDFNKKFGYPLSYAILNKQTKRVEWLLEKGAKVSPEAVKMAEEQKDPEILRLIKNPPNIIEASSKNAATVTPLFDENQKASQSREHTSKVVKETAQKKQKAAGKRK